MTKFSVDYNDLDQQLNRQKVYKLKDVQHRITKVAFDVVRFIDGDQTIDNLWKIENTTDGDVIVAMYKDNDSGSIEITASHNDNASHNNTNEESNWSAIPSKTASSITIFYKNDPIKKVSFEEINLDKKDDPSSFCKAISIKLASDQRLVKSLLKSINKEETDHLLTKYPELNG